MRVYAVSGDEGAIESESFHTTKVAAFQCARAVAKGGHESTVTLETVTHLRGAKLAAALLNRSGWSDHSEVVKVFPADTVRVRE